MKLLLVIILLSANLLAVLSLNIGNSNIHFSDELSAQLVINSDEETKKLFFISHSRHLQPAQLTHIENSYGFKLQHINGGLYYAFGMQSGIGRYINEKNTLASNSNESSPSLQVAPAAVTNKYLNDNIINKFPEVSKSNNGDLIIDLHAIVNSTANELENLYRELNITVIKKSAPGVYKIQIAPNKLMPLLQRAETLYIEPGQYPQGIDPLEQLKSVKTGLRNLIAAQQSSVDDLWIAPYNLSGSGVKVGVVDGGEILTTHQEFQDSNSSSRVTDKTATNTTSSHATHVAGTIGAEGVVNQAHGMANNINIYGYYFGETSGSESVQDMIDDHSIYLSNHSYGVPYSYISDSDYFGYYSTSAQSLDSKIAQNPNHIYFKSAGNNRDDYDYDHNDAWDDHSTLNSWGVVSMVSTTKNIIVIAAADNENESQRWYTYKDTDSSGGNSDGDPFIYLNPTSNDYNQSNLGIAYFSSSGPTRDGRIKPDLTADGYNLYSPDNTGDNQYISYNGTSMASPTVTGTAALIIEAYRNIHGASSYMRSDLMKALLINTADDAGRAGPDYEFGYGVINAKAAVDLLQTDNGSGNYLITDSIDDNQTNAYTIVLSESAEINISLAWVDPAGDPSLQSDILINDLDLYIEADNGDKYYPWSLDKDNPSALATKTGQNHKDNAVKVEATLQAGTYTIKVYGYEVMATQDYALILGEPVPLSNNAPTIDTLFGDITLNEDNGSTSFDINISDVESDDLNLTVESNNTAIITVTQNWTDLLNAAAYANALEFNLTTVANANGIAKITITVDDGDKNSTTNFDLNVTPVDDIPTLEAISTQLQDEDFSEYNITLEGDDVDGDPITYNASSSNTGIVTVTIAYGNLSITPVANANGIVTIEVNATANGETATQTFSVEVTAINDTPVLTAIANPADQLEDFGEFNITLDATDVESDAFSFAAKSNNTTKATVSVSGNILSIYSVANNFGTVNIDVNVTQDSNSSLTDTQSITFSVITVNDKPMIDTLFTDISIQEDNGTTYYDINISDVEGDDLNLTVESNNTAIITVAPNWTNLLNATAYSNSLDFNISTIANANGIAKITITVDDGDKNSTTNFDLNVTPVDDIPTLEAITTQLQDEDFSEYNITLEGDDVDGDPITYSASSDNTTIATVVINDGKLLITPIANAHGSVTIEVNATANSEVATQTFTLDVTSVDDAPQFDTINVPSSKNEDFPDFNITLNATDVESHSYSFNAKSTNTDKITVVLNGSLLTVSSVANEFGSISIDVNVTQDSNISLVDTKTLTFTIDAINDAPTVDTVFDDVIFTSTDTNQSYDINISDIEGDDLNLTVDSNNSDIVTVTTAWSNLMNASNYSDPLTFTIIKGEQSGTARITILVKDWDKNSTSSFNATVEGTVLPLPAIIMYLLN